MATNLTAAAAKLTSAQRACLLDALSQDPHGARTPCGRGRSRAKPCFLDARTAGPLAECGLLGWSAGFDDANTLEPAGRALAEFLRAQT